jgi:hypothetical protein
MKIQRATKITVIFICGLLSFSCSGSRQLSNGFVLEYMNGCEARIFHPKQHELKIELKRNYFNGCGEKRTHYSHDSFVRGNIESYAVRDNWVTGFSSTNCLDAEVENLCEGYFLLNTATNEIQDGMSEQEWEQALKKINWQVPELIKLKKSGQSIRWNDN